MILYSTSAKPDSFLKLQRCRKTEWDAADLACLHVGRDVVNHAAQISRPLVLPAVRSADCYKRFVRQCEDLHCRAETAFPISHAANRHTDTAAETLRITLYRSVSTATAASQIAKAISILAGG